MPAVDKVMARSLKAGFMDLLTASLRPALQPRDATDAVGDKITDVKTAFSSWDNCMNAAYCKWPVIAVIVIGGLIIFSVVWCIARCVCCGLSCCCECCYCLKCCGECCGCCSPPRKRSNKYLDEPFIPPHHAQQHAYRPQEPMNAGPAPSLAAVPPLAAFPPQYAEFDMKRKSGLNEDALPEMPSWEGAGSKKVLVEEQAVELTELKRPEANGLSVANGQNRPGMTGLPVASRPLSPMGSPDHGNPYGPPAAHTTLAAGHPAAGGTAADPYGHGVQGYNYDGYGHPSASLGPEPAYGVAGASIVAGRRSPQTYNDPGYGHEDGHRGAYANQSYYNDRPQHGHYDDYTQPADSYGVGYERRSPPAQALDMHDGGYGATRRSPAPQAGYGYGLGSGYTPTPEQSQYQQPAPQGAYPGYHAYPPAH